MSIPHPTWATHAVQGYLTENLCRVAADVNAPSKDYGIRQIGEKDWEWYYPKYSHAIETK